MSEIIEIFEMGVVSFEQSLKLMNELHLQVSQKKRPPLILLLEHAAVVTMGNRNLISDLKFDPSRSQDLLDVHDVQDRKISMVPYFRTDRGGSATAHEPGQLVVYPLLPIDLFGRSIRAFVAALEDIVIATCAEFGVNAGRDAKHPGVWVKENKIAALGVRVSAHVTKHGLAFNVSNTLEAFQQIIPCGIEGRGVTSLCLELSKHRSSQEILRLNDDEFLKVARQNVLKQIQCTVAHRCNRPVNFRLCGVESLSAAF